jgi:hypothetical protein
MFLYKDLKFTSRRHFCLSNIAKLPSSKRETEHVASCGQVSILLLWKFKSFVGTAVVGTGEAVPDATQGEITCRVYVTWA